MADRAQMLFTHRRSPGDDWWVLERDQSWVSDDGLNLAKDIQLLYYKWNYLNV